MTMNKKEMVLRQQTQEKEMDLHPGETMVQTERDLQLSPKSRSISGVYQKDHRKNHQGHRTLIQLKKTGWLLAGASETEKEATRYYYRKNLRKGPDIMGPLPKLWLTFEQVNSGSGSSSTVEGDTVTELLGRIKKFLPV